MENTLGKLKQSDVQLLVCDLQSGKKSGMYKSEATILNSRKICKTAKILGIPVIASTHNKEKNGEIIEEIKKEISKDAYFLYKTLFSMITLL